MPSPKRIGALALIVSPARFFIALGCLLPPIAPRQ